MSDEQEGVSVRAIHSAADQAAPKASSGGGDKMSVFSDFQRMWMLRFPQSSLSDAWELDVRASLQRHKKKIAELSKELEQEQLYVEYLESLLNDVEKFRESGGDPSAAHLPAETEKTPSASKDDTVPQKADHKPDARVQTNGDTTPDHHPPRTDAGGALQQCITELSSNLRKTDAERHQSNAASEPTIGQDPQAVASEATVTQPKPASHFVTVIEVPSRQSQVPPLQETPKTANDDEKPVVEIETEVTEKHVSALAGSVKKIPPRPPPKFIRRAAPVEPPTVPMSASTTNPSSSHSSPMSSASKPEPDHSSPTTQSSSLERNLKPSEILRQKSSDSLDIKHSANYRKTNPDMSRHFDLVDELGRKIGKADSFERPRPEAVRRNQSPTEFSASPTGSLNKALLHSGSPNGSLGKVFQRVNDSVGSRESLSSQGPISERIKSYESISSISSDSVKLGGYSGASHASGHHHHATHQPYESEPLYDTVALDNGPDGEYVYIQAGGNGSSTTSSRDDISNAGSTLPMSAAMSGLRANPRTYHSQSSVQTEPESPSRSTNYMNIDYFLTKSHDTRSNSQDSDGEDVPAIMRTISHADTDGPGTPGMQRKLSGGGDYNRNTSIRNIITSIISSEALYVECLNKMMQYMKAIRATLTTSQPVITQDEFETMFFKIDELHCVHTNFLRDLRAKCANPNDTADICVGEPFRVLAGEISLYGAFLHNYGRAIETVKKCGSNNQQFKEIVSRIVLNSQNEQSLTLEDLLHKPVARVQKNALVLEDLTKLTPQNHPDYHPLRQSHKMIRNFLSEFNVVPTKSLVPSDDKALRRLVKNSFIVELADNHRKLRHLFLFNDVIACAKYKASGRDRFEYELKWFIPLRDICVLEEAAADPKENSPVNILQLKTQACTVRDQIMLESRDEKKRSGDKHRKKLYDLEAQLVLASPNLVLRISNRATNKTNVFFLSSDYERTLWIESIMSLQSSCNLPGAAPPIHIYDLQAWIAACQSLIKTEMGSYLMRNSRDEKLLVGDLHLTIQGLTGMDHAADYLICIEVDSYGHYFRKARTKIVCRSASPLWNESFILELEGSQNVRIILYEDHSPRQILRAKYVIQLSRQWLTEAPKNLPLALSDTITLNTTLRFVPGEVSLRRVPTSKPGALFGAKMQQVLKREKRPFPFILSACIREVERRGMCEVGVYRVSGSASDLARLKKSFETNNYEAEQLLKDVDIHSVTGILKSYLRELPEALFTDLLYPKLFEVFNGMNNDEMRIEALNKIFEELPEPNQQSIDYILGHLIRVHQKEAENKMSLHNLAMVFGPTLLRPGPNSAKHKDLLESSTVDVMAQAGILYCFLLARNK